MQSVHEWINIASQCVEVLAVAVMISFIAISTARWLFSSLTAIEGAYESYRVVLGKTLLIGLELLIAADIISTVSVELTMRNLQLLAVLVLIRTFLGWTLNLEVTGHWPWQLTRKPGFPPSTTPGHKSKTDTVRGTAIGRQ